MVIKVDDEELVSRKRYSQFKNFKDKLVKMGIIDNNMAFPKKQFVPDIYQRAEKLDTFIQQIFTICKRQKVLGETL